MIEEESFEWQKQIRCYYNIDSALTKFLVNEIDYGYEFVHSEHCQQYILFS